MLMGMARMRSLFLVRGSTLFVAITFLVILHPMPVLDRFAMSTTVGFLASGCVLAWIGIRLKSSGILGGFGVRLSSERTN